MAAGATASAKSVLDYLVAIQEADGHWSQNSWLDGRPYWGGIQIDETGFPILLYDMLLRAGAIPPADRARYTSMIRGATGYMVRNGPATQQDRWEEDGGYSAFTIAVEISALLAAAGLLNGRKATTNWFYQERIAALGAEFVPVRYQRDGKYVTGAGVSASIDTGLFLIQQIGGDLLAKTIQLGVEYYPAPPFPEKTPAEAPPEAQALVKAFESTGGPALLALRPAFAGSFEVLSAAT